LAGVRVVLVDDSLSFQRIASGFLSQQNSLELVGLCSRADEISELVNSHRPDVVLLDLAMPGRSGLAAIPGLKVSYPEMKVVVLSLFESAAYRKAAFAAGADEFVAKQSMGMDLMPAIARVTQKASFPSLSAGPGNSSRTEG
jgi:DNA-binding NarL/FixJ family response regulator